LFHLPLQLPNLRIGLANALRHRRVLCDQRFGQHDQAVNGRGGLSRQPLINQTVQQLNGTVFLQAMLARRI
jgi:hypothetical protein